MTFRELVAKNLEVLIDKSEKTKQQIADELGTEQSVISKYVYGTALPSTENIKKLCQILGCSYDDILGKP